MLCAFIWKFLGVTKIECSCLDEWATTGAKADSFIPWGEKKKPKNSNSLLDEKDFEIWGKTWGKNLKV